MFVPPVSPTSLAPWGLAGRAESRPSSPAARAVKADTQTDLRHLSSSF